MNPKKCPESGTFHECWVRKQSQLSEREKKPGYSQRAPPQSTRSGKNSSFITIIRLSEFHVYSGNTRRAGSGSQLIAQRGALAGCIASLRATGLLTGQRGPQRPNSNPGNNDPCPLLPRFPCRRGSR